MLIIINVGSLMNFEINSDRDIILMEPRLLLIIFILLV